MKKLHRLVVTATAAAMLTGVGATPARADHFLTVCDSGDSGIPVYSDTSTVLGGPLTISVASGETYVRYGDILVGVDTDPVTVCVRAPLVGNQHASIVPAPAGYVGVGIVTCSWTGDPAHTGSEVDCEMTFAVFINPAAPLFSCVYVNGVQQNPGCP